MTNHTDELLDAKDIFDEAMILWRNRDRYTDENDRRFQLCWFAQEFHAVANEVQRILDNSQRAMMPEYGEQGEGS